MKFLEIVACTHADEVFALIDDKRLHQICTIQYHRPTFVFLSYLQSKETISAPS